MNNSWFFTISLRYLGGKRAGNAVPILSRISIVAIAVASAAMLITFSAFNGLEYLVKDMYKAFYADIRISAAKGKFFDAAAIPMQQIKAIPGVGTVTAVIEDHALATDIDDINGTTNKQKVITLKGVENTYFKINPLESYVEGVDTVMGGLVPSALAGRLIAQELGVNMNNDFHHISLFYPNPHTKNPELDPEGAFQTLKVRPTGVFSVSDEFDDQYIIAPLANVQELLFANGKYSSVEMNTTEGEAIAVKKKLIQLLGPRFKVETRYEQNQTMYMVMNLEKYVIYLIFVFVLFIASFNMVGALFMLVTEKRKDIAIIRTMGALPGAIRNIFITEGLLWGGIGGAAGLLIGAVVCMVQQSFGLIKLGDTLSPEWPVQLQFTDVVTIFITILIVSLAAAWFPAVRAAKTAQLSLKSQ